MVIFFRDSRFYPNPERFQPERFYPEQCRRGAYLAFGAGPRMCPAIGFSMIQMKMAIVHLIKNFYIELSPNQKEIVVDAQSFVMNPKNGILLKFVPR